MEIESRMNDPIYTKCVTIVQVESRPSVLYKPRLFIDGDMWCALYGNNMMDGIVGFGRSPYLAMLEFDRNFMEELCPGCGKE